MRAKANSPVKRAKVKDRGKAKVKVRAKGWVGRRVGTSAAAISRWRVAGGVVPRVVVLICSTIVMAVGKVVL